MTTGNCSKKLVEGLDYYLEGTRWVFTAHYLRKRGYCCMSGCRHCPYRDAIAAPTPAPAFSAPTGEPASDPASIVRPSVEQPWPSPE